MTPRLTVLSPHRDDAAFSLALTLHEALAVGCAVRVVVCVTRSDYAPHAKGERLAGERVDAVSRIRALEDAAFREHLELAGAAVEWIELGRTDAPLRGTYEGLSFMHPDPMDVGERAEVDAIAAALPDVTAADVCLVPLAVGHHIDHRIARDAAMGAWAGARMAWYEDLPYCCTQTEEAITEHARATVPGVAPRVVGRRTRAEDKLVSLACYPSQVPASKMSEMLRYADRYGGGERVWTLPGPALY